MIASGKLTKWTIIPLLIYLWSACAAVVPDAVRQSPVAESPAASKIASPVRQVLQRMQHDGVTAANVAVHHAEQYSTPLVRVDAMGRVHTAILVTTFDTQDEAALTAHHVAIERTEAQSGLVHAWIPFDRLETVAALPFVRYLRPPSYASRR